MPFCSLGGIFHEACSDHRRQPGHRRGRRARLFRDRRSRQLFFYLQHEEAARQIAAETGATAVRCDVADGEAVMRAVAALPPVDVLVNNAGIAHYGLISQISEADFQRLFAVNVGGVYHCVNAVLPAMLHEQAGCIINVSSMWGQVGASCEAAYSATKGAVIALTRALAQELGRAASASTASAPASS